MKKILINALSARQGGGQTYLSQLLVHLRLFPSLKAYLILPDESFKVEELPNLIPLHSPAAAKNLLFRILWEMFYLPWLIRKLEIDILFCPGGSIPFSIRKGICQTVATFQNMALFDSRTLGRYPRWSKMRMRLLALRWVQKKSFKKADLLIFISHFAERVIDAQVENRRGKSVVIPHGISELFYQKVPQSPVRPGLPAEYVLYVSTLEEYKAHLEVLEAWALLKERRKTREKLIFIGPSYPPYRKKVDQKIKALNLENDVIIHDKIPHGDLPVFYHHAKINLFASSCENCPFILLEMLASGRAILSSHYEPMPEIAGEGALYFDPYQPDTLADLLVQCLDDEERRNLLGQKALERSYQFNWKETAGKTWQNMATLGSE